MKIALKTAMAFLVMALAGCASSVESTVVTPVPRNAPVTVISDRKLDDQELQNLVVNALQKRGYRVFAGGDTMQNPGGTVCRYYDEWTWDMAMYIKSLRVQLINGRTGQVYARGEFDEAFFHGFPTTRTVVNRTFDDLEAKGAFR